MHLFCYKKEEQLCLQSDLVTPASHPYNMNPEPSKMTCMTKHQGCVYGGTWYNIGEGRNPDLGICGNCIGGNLFYETPIRVHEDCLAPFEKVEFDHDGTTYKYCLYFGFDRVDACAAETKCEEIDSYLALLEGFPNKSMLDHLFTFTKG